MKKLDNYIYAFTRDYISSRVKVGSSVSWKSRLWKANHSEWNCGEKWHCLAILDMAACQEDRAFHKWIAKHHPEVNATKIQEFYEMTPSMLFDLFSEYASEHGPVGRTIKMNPGNDPCFDEHTYRFTPSKDTKFKISENSLNHGWKKGDKLTFDQKKIPYGAKLDFINDSSKKCTVSGPRSVIYNGKSYKTLTDLTQKMLGKKVSGSSFWRYNGVLVREIQ